MKEKITTGSNDRPKGETIAQTGEGLPDDSSSIIEVSSDGAAEVRNQDVKDGPLPGARIDAAEQDQSEADHSPARQKDRARDQSSAGGAGPDEDTYD